MMDWSDKKMTGKVKWFNNQRGFGFISGDDGKEVFVHYSGIAGKGFKELAEGDLVIYDIKETEKGVQAINVERTSMVITYGEETYKIPLLA